MSKKIVEELRGIEELLWRMEYHCSAGVLHRIANELEAQGEKLQRPCPTPETPEAETARLSLEFAKWAGTLVLCRAHGTPHGQDAHRCTGACYLPCLCRPLIVDVVLEVLREKKVAWSAWDRADGSVRVVIQPGGRGWREAHGPNLLLTLLRALDAAGVMAKEVSA